MDERWRRPQRPASAHRRLRRGIPRGRLQPAPVTRFYDASVFAFGDTQDTNTLVSETQSYLYPLDNTPAMDFLLP